MQVLPPGQHAARQGLRGILCEPEIVQECADLCGDFWHEKTAGFGGSGILFLLNLSIRPEHHRRLFIPDIRHTHNQRVGIFWISFFKIFNN
ncbi:hypothetical protein Q4S13_02915 [Morganella morganii]|nr:hypothetical protein [Morganella morganii]